MMLPLLDLDLPDGRPVPWNAIWQRRNVLLLVGDEDCRACDQVLQAWGRDAAELASENIQPIAVYPNEPGQVPEGVLVVLDPQGRLAQKLDCPPGSIVAADRFFEILSIDSVHDLGADAAERDTIDWVDFANRQCPECGIATW